MLKHELAFIRRAAYAESTKTAHMLHWKTYAKFCLYFCLQITPANPETICLFAKFLARSFKAPQSIVNYVASVKLWHSLLDLDMIAFNSLEFILTKKGLFRILAHIPNQTAPVTPEILAMFRQLLDISEPTDATFWALFLIAFFTMARKSNLVPDTAASFDPDRQLSREKVLMGNGCVMVIWTWAKNIQNRNRMHKVPLMHIPGSLLCPVKAYRNMCRLVPLDGKHPAFALKSNRGPVPVTYQQFNQKLKKPVGACGLNPDNFSTHSFRRGGATYAFRADVPETLIQLRGDWASDCYKKYLEMGLAEKRGVSLWLAKHIAKKCPIGCGRLYCCVIKNPCNWG